VSPETSRARASCGAGECALAGQDVERAEGSGGPENRRRVRRPGDSIAPVSPLTEVQIKAAFVNLSKGAASRVNVPADLEERPWDDLDYLGWQDPKAPGRSYLVTHHGGRLRAIALRLPAAGPGRKRKTMCDLCHTVGSVTLMVAPRTGKAGQRGDSVGTYICAGLDCSLFVRDKRSNGTIIMEERLTVEQKIDRLLGNLDTFLSRVLR
jgi:treble-clef zinc-finger protein